MIDRLADAVRLYISDSLELGPDVQAAIDPKNFVVNIQTVVDRDDDIDNSDATVEAAAVAHGLADQDGMDYQTGRNWDLYPMRDLITRREGHVAEPDMKKIEAIVDTYIAEPDNSRTPYTD